jgi:hypothetical protein
MLMPRFEELNEELPEGELVIVGAQPGSSILYFDRKHKLKSYKVGPNKRFIPGFLIPEVRGDRFEFMKQALLECSPEAYVLRHFRRGKAFFLCTVTEPA